MNERENRIRAGMRVINEWVKSDPRGYMKADDYEVVSRIMDATDAAREQPDQEAT